MNLSLKMIYSIRYWSDDDKIRDSDFPPELWALIVEPQLSNRVLFENFLEQGVSIVTDED